MDVDTQFSALSVLAREHKYKLNDLGKMTHPKDKGYLGLGVCCHNVLKNAPRWAGCDSYNYLATIDEFIKKFSTNTPARQKLWEKLTGSRSAFLDTVVETAWALDFLEKGVPVLFEEPFSNGKDADIVITLDGKKHWLDALSVDFEQLGFSLPTMDNPFAQPPTREQLISELAKRAKKKYDDKFKDAVTSGSLLGSSVGVLLCVLKEEAVIVPQLYDIKPPPPPRLFCDETLGLNLVWVHILRANQSSDVLKPYGLIQWIRS
jgi:hypothetical protein